MNNQLNTGADWEQSKRLVVHWHKMWAKERAKVEIYEAPPHTKEICSRYALLSEDSRQKIDNLMQALLALKEIE